MPFNVTLSSLMATVRHFSPFYVCFLILKTLSNGLYTF
nr:MAG TPA: hypothetical protein [Caudoviricetes sp.]